MADKMLIPMPDVPDVSASPAPPAPASGPLFPSAPVLEKRTYASSMSYVGCTRRTTSWVRKVGASSPAAAYAAWTAAALFLGIMWLAVLPAWYLVTVVLFGWFMVPFRMIRRSSRKREHLQQAQLATMQAMLIQQQTAIAKQPEV